MELEKDDFRTVIEDTRIRHAALVTLIFHTETQAMALLRLYVTIGMATASGSLAGFAGSNLWPLSSGLAVATIVLIIGAAFCLHALRPAIISNPGRLPNFWQWVFREDVTRKAALDGYLNDLGEGRTVNHDLNIASSKALKWAKYCGAVTPFVALVTGLVSLLLFG